MKKDICRCSYKNQNTNIIVHSMQLMGKKKFLKKTMTGIDTSLILPTNVGQMDLEIEFLHM